MNMLTVDPKIDIYLLGTDKFVYQLAEKPFDPLVSLSGGSSLDAILAKKVTTPSSRLIEPVHVEEVKGQYLGDVIEHALKIAREHNGQVILIQRMIGGFPLYDDFTVKNYPLQNESMRIGVFAEKPGLSQPYEGLPAKV
jgi:hypothetical protein